MSRCCEPLLWIGLLFTGIVAAAIVYGVIMNELGKRLEQRKNTERGET